MRRRRMLLTIVLIVAILLQSVMPLTMVSASTGVEITLDSELYKAVRIQLIQQGIGASYDDANCKIIISQDNLARVTTLDLSNREIDNLENINLFTNLKELNLTANELTSDPECHLEALSGLSLEKLNLSSNKLESVDAISNFDDIAQADITNQEIFKAEIITMDISEESSQLKTHTVTLPNILLKDTGMIEADWITAEVEGNGSVDWTSIKPGSTDLTLNVATGKGEDYEINKGLITINVNIEDSNSDLANTKMKLYYLVIDSEETGIVFKDSNLYKAVKNQLTAGQTENSELESYDTDGITLYENAYDDALILVIKNEILLNKISSLKLNDKKLSDLTGIEYFVGLESDLNLSYNYIDSIEKILELDKNKDGKENEIKDKYIKFLNQLREHRINLQAALEEYNTLKENYETIVNSEDATESATNNALLKMSECTTRIQTYRTLVNSTLNKLYSVYEKEYLLTTLLPLDVLKLSYEDIQDADLETVKGYVQSITSRISALEQADALTTWESQLIKDTFSITDTTTVEGVEVEIENPITAYFEAMNQGADLLGLNDYVEFVETMKTLDAYIVSGNYCLLMNMYNVVEDETTTDVEMEDTTTEDTTTEDTTTEDTTTEDTTVEDTTVETTTVECQFSTALTEYSEMLDSLGIDTTYVNLASTDGIECMCSIIGVDANEDIDMAVSGKLINVTDAELSTYVKLPKIKDLNISDNMISSIEGIEALEELVHLTVYKNLLGTVENVNWSVFTELESLGLGYNQLTDISALEVIESLVHLDVCRNLLSGNFDFYLAGMENLQSANFSYNQYSNIAYLINQYTFLAKAANMTVEEYILSSYAPDISFQYQTLSMATTIVRSGDFVTIDLPKIFAQFEQIDNTRTSFGENSLGGTVLADGTAVLLRTPTAGSYQGIVTVEGYSETNPYGNYDIPGSLGLDLEHRDQVYTTSGIGFGTVCVIDYKVIEPDNSDSSVLPGEDEEQDTTVTPGEDEEQDTPTDSEENGGTETPDNSETIVVPDYGYTVSEGYVSVFTPETSIADFAARLVSLDEYDVKVVNSEKATTNIGTGAVVSIDTKDGEEVTILEVIVKGDVNGDGEIDAIDSGIVRNVINDTTSLVGVYESAADVNCDGDVDSLDALLVLQYRADKISSFED